MKVPELLYVVFTVQHGSRQTYLATGDYQAACRAFKRAEAAPGATHIRIETFKRIEPRPSRSNANK